MYGFLYLDVLHVHTNCKYNKHMYGFLYLDVLHVHTAIVSKNKHMYGFLYLDVLHVHTNICMASFIWMYCMFIHICMASFIWLPLFGCIADVHTGE